MLNTPKPTALSHKNQADYNLEIAPKLVPASPLWVHVVAFYAALHYVDEYATLLHEADEFYDHKTRRWWIQKHKELLLIRGDYDTLYDLSIKARYLCPKDTEDCYTVDSAQDMIRYATQIRDCIAFEKHRHKLP